jgi:hypothetical protein
MWTSWSSGYSSTPSSSSIRKSGIQACFALRLMRIHHIGKQLQFSFCFRCLKILGKQAVLTRQNNDCGQLNLRNMVSDRCKHTVIWFTFWIVHCKEQLWIGNINFAYLITTKLLGSLCFRVCNNVLLHPQCLVCLSVCRVFDRIYITLTLEHIVQQ